MLRSFVATLACLGRYEPAAVLYGGLKASPTAAPPFGADTERLAEVLKTIEESVGPQQLTMWIEHRRRLRDGEVIELARSAARNRVHGPGTVVACRERGLERLLK